MDQYESMILTNMIVSMSGNPH